MRVDTNTWRQNGSQSADLTHVSEAPDLSGPESRTSVRTQERRTPDVFRDAVIALIPALRIHAATRAGSRSEADDLVQETLVRAWCYRGSFQEGTNLKAWLCKIMQNCFYHDLSRQRDTVQDIEGRWAAMLSVAPAQEWRLQYNDMLSALDRLPPDARAALVLIGASGCSYEEAAELAHCPVGTLKSRVNRAREKLANLIDNALDIQPQPPAKVLGQPSLQTSED
ncbi:sigma-70 family RNA polymerase sigma factor [Asticcacaulis sp.]|uniref:sigma-70 family RNA polymerase sigma factor n=1 Tax=Asticcacaulis sp. TaxID=1872648 RepID=UPI002C953B84|nr:sigma-70 family RNA polymerase sigma factor [Asticcacaulis sp.]HTM79632.1 sigma-70 family RNA polymerase sigma factor [Asticcacaulis sp.]